MATEPPFRTLVDVLDQSLAAFGARDLFLTKRGGRWVSTTYAEFGRMVERFAGGLASLGVERGDRVAIISNNRIEWAVTAYACYRIGAALVPMYEAQNPAEWEFIVRDCEAAVVVVGNEKVLGKGKGMLEASPSLKRVVLIDGATNGDARVLSYESLLGAAPASGATPSRPGPDDVAAILYTSGTTGNPKGVVLTHGNLASNVCGAHTVFRIRSTDRSLSILPWAHAFGQTAELHTFISFGAAMALSEGVDKILDNLREVQPSILICVPTIFNRLYSAVRQQLETKPPVIRKLTERALAAKAKERGGRRLGLRERLVVRLVDRLVFSKVRTRLGGRLVFAVSGGAALSREVAEFIDSIGVVVFEGYGLTETSPVISANGPDARRIGSVGRPFPGVRVEIDADRVEHGSPEPNGRREGEIVAYGPNIMKGYFHRPGETSEVFTADGGFRTGDMGYVDEDRFLFITGRIKEQYKLENGKYVVPSPLEDKLKLSPYIANAMVYGDNKPFNVALLVPNLQAVQKWCAEHQVDPPRDIEELAKSARVRDLFAAEIAALSTEFKGFERITDFAFVPEFTVDNGLLTPKMSLKRRRVIDLHAALLARLYAGKDKHAPSSARATA